jgi:hypothetical protein
MPSITLSSAGTAYIATDYIGAKTTSINVSFTSSTSSAAYQLQGTLDDPMRVTSPTWFLLSTTTFASSTNFDTPTLVQVQTPLAGVRINSTGLSSSAITLRVLQNAGG